VFFCNEVRSGEFFDLAANTETAALLTCEHEVLEPIYYSPEEMIDILSAFEFVIGMRMHSLIFAAIAAVPFVAVSRVDKVDNFMQLFDLEVSGSVCDCDAARLIADAERLLEKREAFRSRVSGRIDELRQECWRNVELLDALLDERKLSWRKATVPSLRLILSENRSYRRFTSLMSGKNICHRILHKLGNTLGMGRKRPNG
jgi:polysaccharide pyruvyl transferase WcaK-like protein